MKRLVKWVLVAWLLGEVYTRWGRDVLFGPALDEPEPQYGDVSVIRAWVMLPEGVLDSFVGKAIVGVEGNVLGHIEDQRWKPGIARAEVLAAIGSEHLGWPVNVALAQVPLFTLRSLGFERA